MIIGVEQFMVSPLRRRYKNILTFDRISVVINNANLLIFEDKLYIYIYIYIYEFEVKCNHEYSVPFTYK